MQSIKNVKSKTVFPVKDCKIALYTYLFQAHTLVCRLFNGLKFRIHSVSSHKDGPKKLIFNLGLTCYRFVLFCFVFIQGRDILFNVGKFSIPSLRDYMETNWAIEAGHLKELGSKFRKGGEVCKIYHY